MAMSLHPNRPKRPLLRYPGSKNQLAEWIVSHIPVGHDSYAEPFGGSAAVLTAKDRSRMETYNDLSGELVNMLVMFRERRDDLIELIRYTYYSREEFSTALQPCDDPLERARRFYARCWMSIRPFDKRPSFRRQTFISRGKAGGSSPMTTAATQMSYVDHLYWYADRLRGVAIENMDALAFIGDYDHERAFFYVDPPYVKATRDRANGIYLYDDMGDDAHAKLAAVLHEIRGMAVVSGYAYDRSGEPNDLYRHLFEDRGWSRVDRVARIDGGGSAIESLWLCPRTQCALVAEKRVAPQQLSLMEV